MVSACFTISEWRAELCGGSFFVLNARAEILDQEQIAVANVPPRA
jgi:hypothetical protein